MDMQIGGEEHWLLSESGGTGYNVPMRVLFLHGWQSTPGGLKPKISGPGRAGRTPVDGGSLGRLLSAFHSYSTLANSLAEVTANSGRGACLRGYLPAVVLRRRITFP